MSVTLERPTSKPMRIPRAAATSSPQATSNNPEVCEIIQRVLPAYASKVPDPSSTEKVETIKVNNEHARKDLRMHFTPLDQTISDTAKSLA